MISEIVLNCHCAKKYNNNAIFMFIQSARAKRNVFPY